MRATNSVTGDRAVIVVGSFTRCSRPLLPLLVQSPFKSLVRSWPLVKSSLCLRNSFVETVMVRKSGRENWGAFTHSMFQLSMRSGVGFGRVWRKAFSPIRCPNARLLYEPDSERVTSRCCCSLPRSRVVFHSPLNR